MQLHSAQIRLNVILSEWKRNIKDFNWNRRSDHVMCKKEYWRHVKIAQQQINDKTTKIVDVSHGKGICYHSYYITFNNGHKYVVNSSKQERHYIEIGKLIRESGSDIDHFGTIENHQKLLDYIVSYYENI